MLDPQITSDADAAAHIAADLVAHAILGAFDARGSAVIALSGGRGPEAMFVDLASRHLPWSAVSVLQVDERVAPAGSPARNLTLIERTLGAVVDPAHLYAMPVDDERGRPLAGPELVQAAGAYGATLTEVCGGVIDCVHLGLGDDGHTASLVPDDSVLSEGDRAVAITGRTYQELLRMTLTYPTLAAARSLVWLVTGDEKADVVPLLVRGDASIPAGRVRPDRAMLVVDHAAASGLPPS